VAAAYNAPMGRRTRAAARAPARVLVLGRDARSFLGVIRSLGRQGVEVHVAWCDSGALALKSRYIAAVHRIPQAEAPEGAWLEALEGLLDANDFQLVIPTNDPAVVGLRLHRERLAGKADVYQLNDEAFALCYDKHATHARARSLEIPVPREVLVGEQHTPNSLVEELGAPVVLKPRASFAFGRKKWEHQVRKARNAMEVEVGLAALQPHGEVLAQENVPGRGVGVEVLAREGEVLLAFQHERLHEPLMGGGSSYRRSTALDPELLAAVRALARSVRYSGVGMFEFKREPETGRWWLIEINGRFWGSLPLALAAGADFPWALYRVWVEGARELDLAYRVGVCCRHLTMDATWIWRNLRADRTDPLLATVSPRRLFAELSSIPLLREHVDSFALDDPAPGLAELGSLGGVVAGAAVRKLRRLPYRSRVLRRLLTGGLRRALIDASSVLFVCKGNICRSPFAEAYARSRFPDSVEVSSSGTYSESSRSCPPEAWLAAGAFGVDLSTVRSRVLDAERVRQADLILVFDADDLARVTHAFPEARGKTHRLGLLAPRGEVDVRDPYGGGFGLFEAAYAAIAGCLDAAAEIYARRAPLRAEEVRP